MAEHLPSHIQSLSFNPQYQKNKGEAEKRNYLIRPRNLYRREGKDDSEENKLVC